MNRRACIFLIIGVVVSSMLFGFFLNDKKDKERIIGESSIIIQGNKITGSHSLSIEIPEGELNLTSPIIVEGNVSVNGGSIHNYIDASKANPMFILKKKSQLWLNGAYIKLGKKECLITMEDESSFYGGNSYIDLREKK